MELHARGPYFKEAVYFETCLKLVRTLTYFPVPRAPHIYAPRRARWRGRIAAAEAADNNRTRVGKVVGFFGECVP
jgi:hypothetical protein